MVIRASLAPRLTEIWRRYDESVQRRRRASTEVWEVRVRQQLDLDRVLLETSQRIIEESRDLKRRIRETLACLGR